MARLPLGEIRAFVGALTLDKCFDPETWKHMTVYVRVIPDGDALPSRAPYNQSTNDLQVAVSYLHSEPINENRVLWFALPDVLASKLITGRTPEIAEAFRITPEGQLIWPQAHAFEGRLEVDPSTQDFFRKVIEERKRPSTTAGISDVERQNQDLFLKVLASLTGYGIFRPKWTHGRATSASP